MHRTFITTVLAAAIAITGLGVAPAQAGDKDLARFLVGVATIGIIAAAIEDGKRHDNGHVTRQDHYTPPVVHAPQRPPVHVAPRPLPDRARIAALPTRCLQTVTDRRGARQVYAAGCLQRNDIRVNALPDRCALAVIGPKGGQRNAFDAQCLANYGYRTARR